MRKGRATFVCGSSPTLVCNEHDDFDLCRFGQHRGAAGRLRHALERGLPGRVLGRANCLVCLFRFLPWRTYTVRFSGLGPLNVSLRFCMRFHRMGHRRWVELRSAEAVLQTNPAPQVDAVKHHAAFVSCARRAWAPR